MSETKTAWDLASRFGQIAVGEERWDVGIGVAFVTHGAEAEALTNHLSAIPADSAEQIAALTAEVDILKKGVQGVIDGIFAVLSPTASKETKDWCKEKVLDELAEIRAESAGEQARRTTAGPLRQR